MVLADLGFRSRIFLSAVRFNSLYKLCVPLDQTINLYLMRCVKAQIRCHCVAQIPSGSQRQPNWQSKNWFSWDKELKFWVKAFVPNGVKYLHGLLIYTFCGYLLSKHIRLKETLQVFSLDPVTHVVYKIVKHALKVVKILNVCLIILWTIDISASP